MTATGVVKTLDSQFLEARVRNLRMNLNFGVFILWESQLEMFQDKIYTLCEFLPWDSNFFGARIARIKKHYLDSNLMEDVFIWCHSNRIDCLYFLVDPNHYETMESVEKYTFQLVDIRITLGFKNLLNAEYLTSDQIANSLGFQIRKASKHDINQLVAIAQTAHKDTRFFYDPHFPDEKCSNLYATWISNSLQGFADIVLVAEKSSNVIGYITCKIDLENLNLGHIGLLAVDEKVRGLGIGPALVNQSLYWFRSQAIDEVRVPTQGRNIAAQRLYQRCGFLTHSLQLWYHKWFSEVKL